MAVSGIAGSTSTSSLTGSRQTIAENFDTFLSLLTTQLKNQNPLDPLDTNQFTQQLVQFTSVEQQLRTNDFLAAMMQSSQTAATSQAVDYIGKTVTASGVKSDLVNGKASWSFNLAANAPETTVTIKDGDGNIVYMHRAALPAGKGSFQWDGVTSDGGRRTSGTYSISIDARNASGGRVSATTETSGKVTGVDLSGPEPVLLVGTSRMGLSTVTSVAEGS